MRAVARKEVLYSLLEESLMAKLSHLVQAIAMY